MPDTTFVIVALEQWSYAHADHCGCARLSSQMRQDITHRCYWPIPRAILEAFTPSEVSQLLAEAEGRTPPHLT